MPTEDDIQRLRLVRSEGVGPITCRRLLDRYRTPAEALAALPRLARAGGKASPPVIPTEADARREFEQTEQTRRPADLRRRPRLPAAAGATGRRAAGDRGVRRRRPARQTRGRDRRRPQRLRRRPAAGRDAGRGPRRARHHRLRPRARHRRHRAHRRHAHRPHRRRHRRRVRRALSGREHQSAAPDRRTRRGADRGHARHRSRRPATSRAATA